MKARLIVKLVSSALMRGFHFLSNTYFTDGYPQEMHLQRTSGKQTDGRNFLIEGAYVTPQGIPYIPPFLRYLSTHD